MARGGQCAADGLRRARSGLWLQTGRFDAFWERGLNSWDIAAGSLLIREAGGFVTGADGEANFLETGSICCGNEIMHRELLGILRAVA